MKTYSDSDHIVIIDASIFIFRYYFSMLSTPQAKPLQTDTGRPTETVYGYSQWLLGMLHDLKPKYVAACFDESLTQCFRNDIYPAYKSSRSLPDDDLAFQLLACKRVTGFLGIPCYASSRFEADDLIASIAWQCLDEGKKITVLTHDKDLMQVLGLGDAEDMVLWNYPKGDQISRADVYDRMGVQAHQVADYLALVGDVSDDVPGVPGVGKKTAAALLQHYPNWQAIKANMEEIHTLPVRGAKSLAAKLTSYESQVDMALQLTTVARDAVEISIDDILRQKTDLQGASDLAQALGFPARFYSLLEKN